MSQTTPTSPPPSQHPTTALIQHAYQPPAGFASPAVPVYKASTIFFPTMHAVRHRDWAFKTTYTYGLNGTPTSYVLEERLATLEGARHCQLAPSGLAAITVVNLALLQQGDEVLLPDNVYGPNKDFAERCLSRYGIRHAVYDPLDAGDLDAKITDQTRLVWLEAAGSVTMEFPDLIGLLQVCNARGITTALDNTWGAGLAFAPFDLTTPDGQPLELGVSVHALTKYPSGGGDVLMGSITTRDERLHKAIKRHNMALGMGVGGNDVEAILRGLPSMAVRYAAQDRAARQLAHFLNAHPLVEQVLHPALPDSPGHAHWQQICGHRQNLLGDAGASAGIFSFVPSRAWSAEQVDRFCEALSLFRIGYSWGGPTSLVMAYQLKSDRSLPASLVPLKGDRVIRLCIGLEDAHDLQADLAQALAHVQGHTPTA